MGTWIWRMGIVLVAWTALVAALTGLSATAATTGILTVATSPSLATQILVDGQIANSRSVNGLELAPGVHTVSFTHVPGYTEPPPQGVLVTAGATASYTGSFTQRGQLQVLTVPSEPTEITIDGHPANDYGVSTDVSAPAIHQVCFGAVAGFATPACQSATTSTGALPTIVTGLFLPSLGAPGQTGKGYLRVISTPAVPTQILVDGNIADSWGLNWLELAPGVHTVCFAHVDGYLEPPCQNATLVAGLTTTVPASFAQRGQLRVLTSPAAPGTILVDGVARDSWGVWTDFTVGLHQVCFGAVAGFSNTPACQTVSVNPGVETDVTGVYS
jgi:hypothetical protein